MPWQRRNPDAVKNLAPNLWVADRPLKTAPMTNIGARMTVVKLSDGGLFLVSPVRLGDQTRAQLDEIGPVRFVVAPSKVHHLFAGDYLAAYPAARLCGAPGLSKKRRDLGFYRTLGDEAPPEWSGDLTQLCSAARRFSTKSSSFIPRLAR